MGGVSQAQPGAVAGRVLRRLPARGAQDAVRYRITLTCNLLLSGDTAPRPEGDDGVIDEITGLLRDHFTTPATHSWGNQASNPPSRLVYLLDHEYTPRALKWTRLKGADARRVPLLRQAAERAGFEAILGLADVKTTHDAWSDDDEDDYYRDSYYDDEDEDPGGYYDSGRHRRDSRTSASPEYTINDQIDTEVTLSHWTGPDGTRLEETSLSVSDAEVCASTPNGDLVPYESEYEGYMGNWGNTLDRWYHQVNRGQVSRTSGPSPSAAMAVARYCALVARERALPATAEETAPQDEREAFRRYW